MRWPSMASAYVSVGRSAVEREVPRAHHELMGLGASRLLAASLLSYAGA